MFNQETSSSTNYLILACMLISFARRFLFSNWMFKWIQRRKNDGTFLWSSVYICMCVYTKMWPICQFELRSNLGGLNWRVVACLLDICKVLSDGSLWKHGNYLKTLNSVANLPHSHESSHVQPFLLACLIKQLKVNRFESLSPHFKKLFKRCSSQALGRSPVWAWCSLKAGKRRVLCFWRAVISRSCYTGGFALCAPVYTSKLKCLLKCHDNIILGPESSWQKSKLCT